MQSCCVLIYTIQAARHRWLSSNLTSRNDSILLRLNNAVTGVVITRLMQIAAFVISIAICLDLDRSCSTFQACLSFHLLEYLFAKEMGENNEPQDHAQDHLQKLFHLRCCSRFASRSRLCFFFSCLHALGASSGSFTNSFAFSCFFLSFFSSSVCFFSYSSAFFFAQFSCLRLAFLLLYLNVLHVL